MSRPRLLDLFCGAGGCAVGYHRAGFDVVGVDNRPQPRYPFPFVLGDALGYAAAHGGGYDVIHASPPCQRYSVTRTLPAAEPRPDLLGPTRDLLVRLGVPWVIENVEGARRLLSSAAVMLCGARFGLRVYRHRLFEVSLWPNGYRRQDYPRHRRHAVRADGAEGTGRKARVLAGAFCTVAGHVGSSYAGPAMGIDWMTGRELAQAVPPAYTEWVGVRVLRDLGRG